MTVPQHLSWQNFRSTVFLPGQQRVHRVLDAPCIEVFGDGVLNRIGVLIEVPSDTTIPPALSRLTFISTRIFAERGRCFIEVATASAPLQREFYHFAVAVAERVMVEERPAIDAIGVELQCFGDLLQEQSLLGIERQLGLLGELIFLERTVKKAGMVVLDAWLGPLGEPHDFRYAANEFEIKTTVAPRRIHTIHGAEQLVPSNGCSLYLVSVLLGPPGAGGGFSLGDKVTQLVDYFATVPNRLIQFNSALEATGFRSADNKLYTRQFAMRRLIAVVPVNDTFPAITRPTIQNALGGLASRIDSVQYDVDVEGLEHEDGSANFESAIPN